MRRCELHSRLPPPFGVHGSVNPKKKMLPQDSTQKQPLSRTRSQKTEPKKQNAYASFDWRKKQPTGRKIHPAMAVTKRPMSSRNDVLISGPEPILDGAYKLPNVE